MISQDFNPCEIFSDKEYHKRSTTVEALKHALKAEIVAISPVLLTSGLRKLRLVANRYFEHVY